MTPWIKWPLRAVSLPFLVVVWVAVYFFFALEWVAEHVEDAWQ